VDRERFSHSVTDAIGAHPRITLVREEIPRVPSALDGPVILATGPLTSDSLSADIAAMVGSDHLYFYDAISPIVLAESIDRSKVFRASRWGRSLRGAGGATGAPSASGALSAKSAEGVESAAAACGVDDGEGDYLNCPFTKEEYERFYAALMAAERAPL